MHLGLGAAPVTLQDGFTSWNACAADAVDLWNDYLDFITFSSVSAPSVPEVSGDGVNSTFFSNTVFGDSFGEDTLAVTVWLNRASNGTIRSEADVVVNQAVRYDSYRGPLQTYSGDLHRVLLHEFGHVLGLSHVPDLPPGKAIMEPIISDLDHLGADDIEGANSLYGAAISNISPSSTRKVGDFFSASLLANNNPTSYSAVGLPPGLKLNPRSGDLSGILTTAGDYGSVLIAHGPVCDAYWAFSLKVLGWNEVPGLLKILPGTRRPVLADPGRARIYTLSDDSLDAIDIGTWKTTNLMVGHNLFNLQLSVSADGSTLLYTDTYGSPDEESRIDLASLNPLPPIAIPGSQSAVLEGLDNRAYVAGPAAVYQFDAISGELQKSFSTGSSNEDTPVIVMSPDRATLFVAQRGTVARLASYDVSGPVPILLQERQGNYSLPTPSPDGRYLYYVAPTADLRRSLVVRAHLPALTPSATFGTDYWIGSIAVNQDGSIYEAHAPISFLTGVISIYDGSSLQKKGEIDPNILNPNGYPQQPISGLFDASGNYFFCPAEGSEGESWIFSTDPASVPAAIHPTKNLLNISTRARVEEGEDAMIGGFIVQGSDPKKILIRGIGPSLPIDATMSDPVLDLYDASGKLLASNDNWISNRLKILGTQLAPASEREPAILMTLAPGSYTAVVRDHEKHPGLALMEVYDLAAADSLLANISTRGKVGIGDNALIGGFIVGGKDATKVLVRAVGPSLAGRGLHDALADPVLELYDGKGHLISTNDNWRSTQQAQIARTGIPPSDNRESAIVATLDPGKYTAIVRGRNNTSGVAVVEVYNLDVSSE